MRARRVGQRRQVGASGEARLWIMDLGASLRLLHLGAWRVRGIVGFFPEFSRLFFCFLLLLYTNIIYPRSSFTITVKNFIEKSPIVRNNPRPLMVPPKGGRHLSFPFRRHCGHVLWMYCTDRQAGRQARPHSRPSRSSCVGKSTKLLQRCGAVLAAHPPHCVCNAFLA